MTNQTPRFGATRVLIQLPVAQIEVGERLRDIDAGYVEMLAQSIGAIGLTSPVEVRAIGESRYRLIAGGHRFAAVCALGAGEIDAFVVEADDLTARLRELHENLYRHDLNFFDRAAFLAEAKAIHEALYPETKQGVAGGKARQKSANEIVSFAESTALAAGYTPRTIQLAVNFYGKLAPAARERLRASPIAKDQSQLIALSKLPHDQQLRTLDVMQAPDGPAKVKQAIAVVLGKRAEPRSVDDRGFQQLVAIWTGRSTKRARDAFVAWLREKGEI